MEGKKIKLDSLQFYFMIIFFFFSFSCFQKFLKKIQEKNVY